MTTPTPLTTPAVADRIAIVLAATDANEETGRWSEVFCEHVRAVCDAARSPAPSHADHGELRERIEEHLRVTPIKNIDGLRQMTEARWGSLQAALRDCLSALATPAASAVDVAAIRAEALDVLASAPRSYVRADHDDYHRKLLDFVYRLAASAGKEK